MINAIVSMFENGQSTAHNKLNDLYLSPWAVYSHLLHQKLSQTSLSYEMKHRNMIYS